MNKTAMILALALGVSAWSAMAQQHDGPPPAGERGPRHDRFARPGGPGRPEGFVHLLPPWAAGQLNLTADQQKQLEKLHAQVKAKLESILTPEQLEALKRLGPPHVQDRPEGGQMEHRDRPQGERRDRGPAGRPRPQGRQQSPPPGQ